MAMTPSQLSIIVKSQGVEKAAQDLEKLAKAASSVDAETKAFVIAQSKLADSSKKVSQSSEAAARGITTQELAMIKLHESANRMNAVLDRQHSAQQKLVDNTFNRALKEQEVAARKAEEALTKQNKELERQSDALKKTSNHGNIFNNTLRSMATAALAYMGVNFAMGIIKEADAWSLMQSKLKLATGSMEGAKVAQKDLFETSQRLRVPLDDTAKLFTRMAVPLQKMGQTTSDVKRVVESFSMALKLGGATGQEASSAMLQLSQSFNAGRLNGGEFNSVAEAAPSVLRALEVELVRVGKGADLARYGLKELAAKGVLSTEIMAEALKRAAPKWEEDFKQLPLTFDGAMTRIKNAWQKAVGEVGGDTKFNQRLAESLKKIEDVLPVIATAVGNAFLFMVDNAENFITVLKVLAATIALVKLGSLVTLVGSAYTAFTSATTAVAGLTAALKLLHLTPVGLALLAVAAAGTAVYSAFKDYNKETEQTIENNNKMAQNGDLLKAMEAETLELKQQADAARIKAGLGAIYSEDIKRATKAFTEEEKAVLNVRLAKDALLATQMKIQAANRRMGMEDVNKPSTEPLRKELESAVALVKSSEAQVEAVKKKSQENDNLRSQGAIVRFGNERNALIENARVAALTKNQIALEARDKALKLLDEEIEKYDLRSNEAGMIAINNRKLKIARDYQEALDKIKTPVTNEVSPEITNLDRVNKLLADQNTLNREWVESQRTKVTIGQRFAEDVESQNKALEVTLKRGTENNKLLTEAEKRQIRKTLETNKEALAVAKIVEAQQKYREADQERMKRVDKAGEELLTEEARLEVLERQLNLGEQTNIAKQQQSIIEAEIALSALIQVDATGVELVNAQRLLKVRQDTLRVMQSQEYKDDNEAQAKKYEDSFQAANKKISDGLYNAIGKGSDSAIKKLTQDLKSWAARLILSPIIDPISKFGAGIMNPNAASAAGGAGNIMELGSTIYKSITTGFSAASAASAEAFTSFATSAFGETLGLSSSAMAAEVAALTGSGTGAALTTAGSMGASAVSMMPYVAAAVAAFQGVKAINGEYRLGGLSADMGALLGVMPRLFGMAEKKFADQTVTGNLGTTDLSRNQAWTQSGGVFRSDRADTWKYMLNNSTATTSDGKSYVDTANLSSDKALLTQLTDMYSAVKVASTEYAKALGLNAESIKSRTDAINFTFGKTAEETSANISKAFEGITNNIAKDLLGSLTELALQNESYAATMGRLATNISATNGMFKALGYNLFELNTNGIKAANSLVTLFGGLDKFQAIASDYYDKFYSESEKTQVKVNAMTKSLKDLGVELPSSRAAFRGLVEAAQKAGNNELYASLMKLSSAFAEITAETGDVVSNLGQLPQAMRDTFEALAKDAERWLNLSKSASSLRGSINEILTGATNNSAKKAENLWKMLESDISVEQKMSLAGELKDVILSKYQVERDSITKLLDLSRQLKNFVEGLKVGSMSPLTTTQKLEEAKKQYEGLLAKAKGGDTTAQGALTGSATTYLELARTALASGTEYRTIFDEITTSLEGFSVDTQTAEEKMVELNKSQEIELMKLVSQLDIIESVADSYYKTSLVEMTKQLTVMQEMYIKLGNLDGIAVDLAKLPAEMAAVLAGKFGRTGGEEFIEGLYKKYTGKSAQEIDEQGMDYWAEELMKYGRDYTVKAFIDSVKPPAPVVNKPSDTTTILVNTVVQLKEEISALRDDQNKQTEALIAATVISNQENATEVVEGVDEMYNKKNWRDVNAPALV